MMPNVVLTGTDNIEHFILVWDAISVHIDVCDRFCNFNFDEQFLSFWPFRCRADILSSQPKGSTWPRKFDEQKPSQKVVVTRPEMVLCQGTSQLQSKAQDRFPEVLIETNQPQGLRYKFCILDTSTSTHIQEITMKTVLWISKLPDI